MRLLVVEDDPTLQGALVRGFVKLGYTVDAASDGREALSLFFGSLYEAIVLDLNLPYLNGFEVLSEIRKENPVVKIIILSARSGLEDKIRGLDLGANDYLTKPFSFKELDARVRALLRRDFVLKDTCVVFGDLRVDTGRKRVMFGDNEVVLTPTEYRILECLALRRGNVVSCGELIEQVWGSEADLFSNSLKVHITGLRKKLPQDILGNVRGQGYYVE